MKLKPIVKLPILILPIHQVYLFTGVSTVLTVFLESFSVDHNMANSVVLFVMITCGFSYLLNTHKKGYSTLH